MKLFLGSSTLRKILFSSTKIGISSVFDLKIRKEISNIAPQKIIDNQRYHDSLIIELLKINSGLICFGRIKRKTSTMPILYSSKLP